MVFKNLMDLGTSPYQHNIISVRQKKDGNKTKFEKMN